MKIKLTRATVVRFEAGEVVEVSEKEASRLVAMNLAERVEEKAAKKKEK